MATSVIVASNNNSVVQIRQNKSIVTSTAGTAIADPIARDIASSAYNKANSANVIAQSAYDFANTLSGGPVSLDGGSF